MVVRLDALSFSQVEQSLIDYFNNQADSQKWKDFFQSSTGRLFIRLLAAFGAFISYLVTVSRRENFITYANNRSSLIGMAQNLGYSVSRGKNEIVELVITPTLTGFIPEFTVVGSVKDLQLITVEEAQLNKGIQTTIKVYIGNLKTENITINTDGLKVFRFSSTNVSDYIRVKLNGSVVPHSDNLKDLFNDKYVIISNPIGAVDIMYLQEGNYVYTPTDILSIEYVELSELDYDIGDLDIDYGIVNSISDVLSYVEPETNDSIRVNAPLYHETQVTIRGREDFLKEFRSFGYNLVDTNYFDFSPAIIDLTYIRDDYTILDSNEISELMAHFEDIKAMGIPLPRIKYPRHFKLELNFNIRKNLEAVISTADVEQDVNTVMQEYEKTLNPYVDLEILERDLEDYSYVKRVRVSVDTNNWQSDNLYRLGDFITPTTPNGKIYMAWDFISQSESSEPIWSYNIGDEIEDGDIVWKCMPRYCKNPPDWYPERYYKVGDLVKSTSLIPPAIDLMFECVKIRKKSGSSIPSFSTDLEDFTEDNELIWVTKPKVNSDPAWQSDTYYSIGDSILEGDFSYECIGFRGKSKSLEPTFKNINYYPIIGVNQGTKKFTVAGDKTEHFLPNDTIRIQNSNGNDGYYQVIDSSLFGGNTQIEVDIAIPSSDVSGNLYMEDTYTRDNDILWKFFNEDEIIFNYNWSDYIKITNNINVS